MLYYPANHVWLPEAISHSPMYPMNPDIHIYIIHIPIISLVKSALCDFLVTIKSPCFSPISPVKSPKNGGFTRPGDLPLGPAGSNAVPWEAVWRWRTRMDQVSHAEKMKIVLPNPWLILAEVGWFWLVWWSSKFFWSCDFCWLWLRVQLWKDDNGIQDGNSKAQEVGPSRCSA